MIKKENIRPTNSEGQEHGYTKVYNQNGTLYYEGAFKNGKEDGHWIYNYGDGAKWGEGPFLNGAADGVWVYYSKSKDGSIRKKIYHIK